MPGAKKGRPEDGPTSNNPTPTIQPYGDAYMGLGWPVFVLSSSKIPVGNCWGCDFDKNKTGPHLHENTPAAKEACTCLRCHGFYAATTDPDRFHAMVQATPRGCLAIRTGSPSGLVVVEVDPPVGTRTLAILDEAGLFPGTIMAMTGRDRGFQLFYRLPDVKISQGTAKLGPGIDVKADGGYVVAPPSVHPKTGRRYMWSGDGRFDYPPADLHPAVVERLRVRPKAPRPGRAGRRDADRFLMGSGSKGTPEARLGGLVKTVMNAPDGQLNNCLLWASCRAGEMVAAGEVDLATAERELLLAAEEAGHPSGGAERTIASGIGRAS